MEPLATSQLKVLAADPCEEKYRGGDHLDSSQEKY
jgi:hypothetical protein